MINMNLISHRGNINGSNPIWENNPDYVNTALDLNYNVEIDVWYIDGQFLLGHDHPKYEININYLKNKKLLCHAKDMSALEVMLMHTDIHCFWHQEDTYTISSNRIPIVYPQKPILQNSIVMIRNDDLTINYSNCYGICSNCISLYSKG